MSPLRGYIPLLQFWHFNKSIIIIIIINNNNHIVYYRPLTVTKWPTNGVIIYRYVSRLLNINFYWPLCPTVFCFAYCIERKAQINGNVIPWTILFQRIPSAKMMKNRIPQSKMIPQYCTLKSKLPKYCTKKSPISFKERRIGQKGRENGERGIFKMENL